MKKILAFVISIFAFIIFTPNVNAATNFIWTKWTWDAMDDGYFIGCESRRIPTNPWNGQQILPNSNQRYANLQSVNMSCADLSGIDFYGAVVGGVTWNGSNLNGTNWGGSQYNGQSFVCVTAANSNLTSSINWYNKNAGMITSTFAGYGKRAANYSQGNSSACSVPYVDATIVTTTTLTPATTLAPTTTLAKVVTPVATVPITTTVAPTTTVAATTTTVRPTTTTVAKVVVPVVTSPVTTAPVVTSPAVTTLPKVSTPVVTTVTTVPALQQQTVTPTTVQVPTQQSVTATTIAAPKLSTTVTTVLPQLFVTIPQQQVAPVPLEQSVPIPQEQSVPSLVTPPLVQLLPNVIAPAVIQTLPNTATPLIESTKSNVQKVTDAVKPLTKVIVSAPSPADAVFTTLNIKDNSIIKNGYLIFMINAIITLIAIRLVVSIVRKISFNKINLRFLYQRYPIKNVNQNSTSLLTVNKTSKQIDKEFESITKIEFGSQQKDTPGLYKHL
jgi:hypothetical protein